MKTLSTLLLILAIHFSLFADGIDRLLEVEKVNKASDCNHPILLYPGNANQIMPIMFDVRGQNTPIEQQLYPRSSLSYAAQNWDWKRLGEKTSYALLATGAILGVHFGLPVVLAGASFVKTATVCSAISSAAIKTLGSYVLLRFSADTLAVSAFYINHRNENPAFTGKLIAECGEEAIILGTAIGAGYGVCRIAGKSIHPTTFEIKSFSSPSKISITDGGRNLIADVTTVNLTRAGEETLIGFRLEGAEAFRIRRGQLLELQAKQSQGKEPASPRPNNPVDNEVTEPVRDGGNGGPDDVSDGFPSGGGRGSDFDFGGDVSLDSMGGPKRFNQSWRNGVTEVVEIVPDSYSENPTKAPELPQAEIGSRHPTFDEISRTPQTDLQIVTELPTQKGTPIKHYKTTRKPNKDPRKKPN